MSAGGLTTPPFADTYRFNRNAMSGGSASSPISKYTLHTGSMAAVQTRMENTAVLTPNGYERWNEETKKMKRIQHGLNTEEIWCRCCHPSWLLRSAENPRGYIYPALYGSFGHTYEQPAVKAGQCWTEVSYSSTDEVDRFPLDWRRISSNEMNKFHINVAREDDPTLVQVFCPKQTR